MLSILRGAISLASGFGPATGGVNLPPPGSLGPPLGTGSVLLEALVPLNCLRPRVPLPGDLGGTLGVGMFLSGLGFVVPEVS
jgi:hypothetical protein